VDGVAVIETDPNVATHDGKAGVQTGEFGLITENGFESLQSFPRGFGRV
jgi:hypothetical protein